MSFTSLRCWLPLVALLLSAAATQAQQFRPASDFVVTNAGDTLRGRIRLKGRSAATLRLYQPQQAPVSFSAATVRSYGIGHTPLRVSQSVGPAGPRRLLVPLVRGYMSLYVGKDTADQVRYYLQPTDTAYVVEVAPATALLTYARLLSDCPSLDIGSTFFLEHYRYSTSGLEALVTDYNHCRQRPSELVRTPSGVRVLLGAKVAAGPLRFNPATDDYYAQLLYGPGPSQSYALQAGLMALFATRSSLGVQVEANYLYLSSTYPPPTSASYGTGTYYGLYGVQVQFSQFQLPVLARYTFGRGVLAPYLNLGPSFGVNFANNTRKQVYNITGTTLTDQVYPSYVSAVSLGGAAGGGLLLHRAGLPGLMLDARYEYQVDNINDNIHHSSVRFGVGVLF